MNGDEARGGAEWPIDRRRDRIDASGGRASQPQRGREARSGATRRQGVNPIYIALGGVVLLLLLLFLLFARGNSNQDKLTGTESGNKVAASSPEKLCASKQTYDLIKRELFRRAAQVRGSDQAAYDRLSAYASLRMENPVMASEDRTNGAVSCSGTLALDLPPGVAVVGGRRTLSADIDYTVQRAADDSGNVVLLRNADAIISPLATLARTRQEAAPPPAPKPPESPAAPETPSDQPASPQAPEAPPAPSVPSAPAPKAANPSFNCANARTKSEIAVCSDSGLASLDRQMASQYVRAVSEASPDQKALLRRTRDRFLGYRDRCSNRSCIADAYEGRMREIADIMQGRWRPR